MDDEGVPARINIDDPNAFEKEKNWQVVNSYAEDGKHKQVINKTTNPTTSHTQHAQLYIDEWIFS
ncbi:MAG: hypothetical protein F6K65_11950 [Moorea sp. SIO3C2]|nr:hypothetical protein [Moorena sp. SIO3C2]